MTTWSLSFEHRCKQARETKTGDKWRNPKTGKTVEVVGRIGHYGVQLLHESGRRTCKLDHYLASDFEKVLT